MDLNIVRKIPFKQYPWFITVQSVHLLVPLISYPYLLRVVGPEQFGWIAVAGSISAVITTISEYGSTFSGVRDVAANSGNPKALSLYYWTSLTVRLLLFALCVISLSLAIIIVPELRQQALLILLSVFIYLPSAVFPQWFFNGVQRMRDYSVFILLSKLLGLFLLFTIVNSAEDYALYPLVQLIPTTITAGIFLIFIRRYGIAFRLPRSVDLVSYVRDRRYQFFSQSISSVYTQMNPVILMSLLRDPVAVGYYAVAEKIVLLAKSIVSPINQLFLPVISARFAESRETALMQARSFFSFAAIVNSVAVILVLFLAEYVVSFIGGEQFTRAVGPVRLLSPIIVLIALNNIAGVHVLLNVGFSRQFFTGIVIGLCVNVGLMVAIFPFFSYNSPAISWSIAESVVLVYYLLIVKNIRNEKR